MVGTCQVGIMCSTQWKRKRKKLMNTVAAAERDVSGGLPPLWCHVAA